VFCYKLLIVSVLRVSRGRVWTGMPAIYGFELFFALISGRCSPGLFLVGARGQGKYDFWGMEIMRRVCER
jgi:hypothetical protein